MAHAEVEDLRSAERKTCASATGLRHTRGSCGLRRVLCSTVESFVPPGIYMGVISDWDFWKAAARLTFVRQPFPPQQPFMEVRGQEFDHRCSSHSTKNA